MLYDEHFSLDRLAAPLLDERKSLQPEEKMAVLRGPITDQFLTLSLPHLYNGASVGKAYLRAVGVYLFCEKNPFFLDELVGGLMANYYGGQTEMRSRRMISEVRYLDVITIYPTVNTLLNLWH